MSEFDPRWSAGGNQGGPAAQPGDSGRQDQPGEPGHQGSPAPQPGEAGQGGQVPGYPGQSGYPTYPGFYGQQGQPGQPGQEYRPGLGDPSRNDTGAWSGYTYPGGYPGQGPQGEFGHTAQFGQPGGPVCSFEPRLLESDRLGPGDFASERRQVVRSAALVVFRGAARFADQSVVQQPLDDPVKRARAEAD